MSFAAGRSFDAAYRKTGPPHRACITWFADHGGRTGTVTVVAR